MIEFWLFPSFCKQNVQYLDPAPTNCTKNLGTNEKIHVGGLENTTLVIFPILHVSPSALEAIKTTHPANATHPFPADWGAQVRHVLIIYTCHLPLWAQSAEGLTWGSQCIPTSQES